MLTVSADHAMNEIKTTPIEVATMLDVVIDVAVLFELSVVVSLEVTAGVANVVPFETSEEGEDSVDVAESLSVSADSTEQCCM